MSVTGPSAPLDPHHLDLERTRFFGRVAERRDLAALLTEGARLVTLVGPGGAGKTRLAREGGRAVASERPGSAWFCDVAAAFSDEELVLAVARAVGLPLEAPGALDARLAAWLSAKDAVLLLLDNGEQLTVPARARVRAWLDAAPALQVVVTSREPLGLIDERLLSVGPLAPDDAAALFVDRASAWDQRVADGPSLLALAEQLDRLPLALELAAARLDLFSLEELRARLAQHLDAVALAPAGGAARHATLRATIAWSWALLTEEEQRACEALSVFHGGTSLTAAALLWGGESQALSRLGSLRRKSLLVVVDGPLGESRYALYEAVRAFALEQLEASGRRTEVEAAHAAAVVQACAGWALAVGGPEEPTALEHLAAERDNLLAVAAPLPCPSPPLGARETDRHFPSPRPPPQGEREKVAALLALHPLLLTRGPSDLHLSRLEAVLESLPSDARQHQQLLLARGEVRRVKGQLDGAGEDFEAVRAWAQKTGDARLEGEALRQWALLEGARGQPLAALARCRRALKLARGAGDRLLEATSLGALGAAHQSLGRLQRAISAHARSLAVLRAVGSPRLQGVELSYLAVATHRLGHLAEAEGLHREALAIDVALGHRRFEAVERTHLGYLHHELGQLEAGRTSYREALALFRAVGDVALEGVALTFLGRLEVEAGGPQAREVLESALALHRSSHHARLEATTLACIGHLCRDRGDLRGARDYFQRALATSSAVEVGFEVLLPAFLGEVLRGLGEVEEARRHFSLAQQAALKQEHPAYALAAALLSGAAPASPERLRASSATSSELRRAVRLSGTTLPVPQATTLTVARDGTWLERENGARVELARRKAVRLVLLALTRARVEAPGTALSWEALLAEGWPGERPVTDSGLKRVYTAVWTLRTLGLEGVLITRGDGYLLEPSAVVAWALR